MSDIFNILNSRADKKARSEIRTLNARVNNIIAHNNDTEGNSELIDIRTGTDGTVYSSAGSAVRNQLSEITSCINYFIDTAYTSDTTEVTADETMSSTMIRQNGNTESNQYTTNLSVSKYENVNKGKYKAHGYTQNNHCLYVVVSSDNTVLEYKKESDLDGAGTKNIDFYITQDDCTVYIGGYSSVSPALYQYEKSVSLNGDVIVPQIQNIQNENNPLYEKTVTVNGDSIAYGQGCTVNGVHWGFMDFIADRNSMTFDKQAVSGGCLSVKSTDSAGRHYICRTVENMNENADYVIFEGGYNDWYLWHRVGSITETMTDEVDDNTVYGALESICRQSLERWHTAKIGFIITHKINTAWRTVHDNSSTEHVTLEDYYQAVRDVCEKYSIPYLDLSKISRFNTELTSYKTFTYNSDGIHPTQTGYETFYVAVIENWLKNL